ncbi:hypothetical protein [Desulfosporosinus shakirovi]|uniref:hypothetical protein n=1 Tax=Desulfosporosinus shakirovi TaxID=2885154 RepID=UPI001E329ACA|nr:hypothetical protein [Desulfosporosinus sp. SRJS8]MCB8814765.1 hypothetical protein [Desulfosporosinus sp. SRJS8]
MKGNKFILIPLTLILICVFAIPVYASVTGVAKFTNTGTYIGGYSYTETTFVATKITETTALYKDDVLVDSDADSGTTYAQGDVGVNNPSGIQDWYIEGMGIVWQGNIYNAYPHESSVVSK